LIRRWENNATERMNRTWARWCSGAGGQRRSEFVECEHKLTSMIELGVRSGEGSQVNNWPSKPESPLGARTTEQREKTGRDPEISLLSTCTKDSKSVYQKCLHFYVHFSTIPKSLR
jgi:hypothetical protein